MGAPYAQDSRTRRRGDQASSALVAPLPGAGGFFGEQVAPRCHPSAGSRIMGRGGAVHAMLVGLLRVGVGDRERRDPVGLNEVCTESPVQRRAMLSLLK